MLYFPMRYGDTSSKGRAIASGKVCRRGPGYEFVNTVKDR